MKKIFTILLLIASSSVFADGIESLKSFNNTVKNFSGNFTQTIKNAKSTKTSTGTFSILRPGYFKWNYQKPEKQLIIADGKHIWLYDEELAQVTKRNQSESINSTPAAILSDKKALDANYTLANSGEKDNVFYVSANPKKQNTEYKNIKLGLLKDGTPANLELQDNFGNQTSIKFENVKINTSVSSSNFKFTPPANVNILDAN